MATQESQCRHDPKIPWELCPTCVRDRSIEENKVASTSNFRAAREDNPALEAAWRELEESEEYAEMIRYGRNPSMLRAMLWKSFRRGFEKGQASHG